MAGDTPRRLGTPTDLIRSVQRALRILEAVGETPGGMSVKNIARKCELHLPTAYHLVRTLAYEGYLLRTEDGDYQLGLELSDRFADLAAAVRGPDSVDEVVRRSVHDTGYSHYIGRMVDGRVAVTGVSQGGRSPHVEDLIVGFDDGAHATALGKALLATMSPQERHEYLSEAGMRRYTDATVTEPERLEYDLAALAAQGVYTEIGQFRAGVGCAAALVRDDSDPRGRVVIACVLPLTDLRTYGPRVKQRLRRAALEMQPLL